MGGKRSPTGHNLEREKLTDRCSRTLHRSVPTSTSPTSGWTPRHSVPNLPVTLCGPPPKTLNKRTTIEESRPANPVVVGLVSFGGTDDPSSLGVFGGAVKQGGRSHTEVPFQCRPLLRPPADSGDRPPLKSTPEGRRGSGPSNFGRAVDRRLGGREVPREGRERRRMCSRPSPEQ